MPMKMKDLEQATGVGRETIRFYIREGLLPEPQRPHRNVAWYDRSFVERIDRIRELQRERALPLHVIKAHLGEGSGEKGSTFQEIAAAIGETESDSKEKLADVAERIQLPAPLLRQLGEVGVIEVGEGEWLDARSVQMVELWARLHKAGFTEELGYGPRQLARYVDSVTALAKLELDAFDEGIIGQVSPERAVMMAEAGIQLMNQILALMRRATLLRMMEARP